MNEYALLSTLIRNNKLWREVRTHLQSFEWVEEWPKLIFESYQKYSEDNLDPLKSSENLQWWVKHHLTRSGTPLSAPDLESIKDISNWLFDFEVDSIDRLQVSNYLFESSKRVLADRVLEATAEDLPQIRDSMGTLTRTLLRGESDVYFLMSDEALEDPLALIEEEEGEPISTGMVELDRLLEGGWKKGKQTVFLGHPGFGKTYYLIWFACEAVRQGKRAVYFALDNTLGEMRKRIYCALARLPFERGAISNEEYSRKLKEMGIDPSLFILVMGTRGKTTVDWIEAKLNYILEEVGPIEWVAVDYADVIKGSNPKKQGWETHDEVYMNLAGLATIFNCHLQTASQGTRGAFGKAAVIDMDSAAGAFAKNNHAAYVVSINQTMSERANNKCWLAFVKARAVMSRYKVAVVMERETGSVLDGGEPTQWLDQEAALKKHHDNQLQRVKKNMRVKLRGVKQNASDEEVEHV